MRIIFDKNIMLANGIEIVNWATERKMEVAWMVKKQFDVPHIREMLKNNGSVYSTKEDKHWENIYTSPRVTIVDAFDRREGITMTEAEEVKDKDTALVNFFCCNEIKPTVSDLNRIYKSLKDMGFKWISFGGSMMMNYDNFLCDEIRVGEALLTGYSCVDEGYFPNMLNPYSVILDVMSSSEDGVVVSHGFLEIGGFTDVEARCVNTDCSVLMVEDWERYSAGSKIKVKPDYYTLVKLADKGYMEDIEYV
jgi:hypothetical protein